MDGHSAWQSRDWMALDLYNLQPDSLIANNCIQNLEMDLSYDWELSEALWGSVWILMLLKDLKTIGCTVQDIRNNVFKLWHVSHISVPLFRMVEQNPWPVYCRHPFEKKTKRNTHCISFIYYCRLILHNNMYVHIP